jgi:hypothetical protein
MIDNTASSVTIHDVQDAVMVMVMMVKVVDMSLKTATDIPRIRG